MTLTELHHASPNDAALDDFSAPARAKALEEIYKPGQMAAPAEMCNMHVHSFFSFNGCGWSPTRVLYNAKKLGVNLTQIVDFDVIDALDETFAAADRMNAKACVGLETRAYFAEFANKVINSPGEPGVVYFMGAGFVPGVKKSAFLEEMAARAAKRNTGVVEKINAYLNPVTVDYDTDVLKLTPAGNATEKHILKAYHDKSRAVFPDDAEFRRFWSEKAGLTDADFADEPTFIEKARGKLVKAGGVAYVQPTMGDFPAMEDVITAINEMRAIPCLTWLDGTSEGERNADIFISHFVAKGARLANIIPDRNWNIKDEYEKQLKVENLASVIKACKKISIPVIVGTELNKSTQKFVDTFDAPEIAPYRDVFMDGAYFLYGHTVMERFMKCGYESKWCQDQFKSRQEINAFYTAVGKAANPADIGTVLTRMKDPSPKDVLSAV